MPTSPGILQSYKLYFSHPPKKPMSCSTWFFQKICSDVGDFPHIIEITLLFHLQLSKLWPDIAPEWIRLALNGSVSQNVLKSDLEKCQVCPNWGQTWHPCSKQLTTLHFSLYNTVCSKDNVSWEISIGTYLTEVLY